MFNIGLYLNDLSLHDASRDLVLVGNQKSTELKIALHQVRPFCFWSRASNPSNISAELSSASSIKSPGAQHQDRNT